MARLADRLRRRRVPIPEAVGTRLGTDDGFRAVVDARSAVQLAGAGHRVEWWIGGDDRWSAPAVEAAVRQDRPGPAPVLEPRMRVAGGDVVATTWAAVASGSSGPAVMVELVNAPPVPVAVAVPVQAATGGAIRRLAVDGRRLLVDGETAAVVDREPGRYAVVDAAADLWETVTGGRAVTVPPDPVRWRIGAAAGARVVPLPHRTALRFAVPAGDLLDNPSAVFPTAERVAAGWAGRLADAATVDLPDPLMASGAHRDLVDLLLADPTPAGSVELCRWGLARAAVERLVHASGPPGDRLVAAARLWRLGREPSWFIGPAGIPLDDLVRSAVAAPAARWALGRMSGRVAALGDARAAADAGLLAEVAGPPDLVAADAPTASVRALADRLANLSTDGLDLLGDVPDAWLGGGGEVHGLATPHGRLGFAIRWHGERPALLWELERHDARPVVLRVPGLDTAFSTVEASGEVLLAAPAGRVPSPRRSSGSSPDGGSFS